MILNTTAKISGSPRQFDAPIHGQGFNLHVELDEVVVRTVYVRGCFEPAVTRMLSGLISTGDTVLDIGANFGFFTLLAARRTGASGRVFAFEPDPLNIERLVRNLSINDFPQASVVRAAVHSSNGSAILRLGRGDNLGVSSLVERGVGQTEDVEVQTVTIDSFLAARSLAHADVIKIDIEGAEVGALEGAAGSLSRHALRHLIIEVHDKIIGKAGLKALFQMLAGAKYDIRYILKDVTQGPLSRMLTPASYEAFAHDQRTRSSDFKEVHILASSPEGVAHLNSL